MNRKKIKKGAFGYPVYERNRVILRTGIYFFMSIAVFLLGYWSTGKKENLLTIVAVLGLLPSSKSLVSVVMYLRIPLFSEAVYQEISAIIDKHPSLYSMYLTTYKLNYPITCFVVFGDTLIGYTEFSYCNVSSCEIHIKDMLKQNSIKNVTVKIFKEQERKKFLDRFRQLQEDQKEESATKETDILTLLCDISL